MLFLSYIRSRVNNFPIYIYIMASITKIFLDILNPKKIYLWVLFIVLLLSIVGYYVYHKNFKKTIQYKKLSDIPNASVTENVQILFFTVDWCPHCKNAKTPWNDFKKGYHQKEIKGKMMQCKEYNMTEKEVTDDGYKEYTEAKGMGAKYNVDSFPTVKMIVGSQVIDFDAKITTYALEQFVENVL